MQISAVFLHNFTTLSEIIRNQAQISVAGAESPPSLASSHNHVVAPITGIYQKLCGMLLAQQRDCIHGQSCECQDRLDGIIATATAEKHDILKRNEWLRESFTESNAQV